MYTLSLFVGLLGLVAASKPGLKYGTQRHHGVATFNNYSKQGNTVCGPMAGMLRCSVLSSINYCRQCVRT